MIGLYRALLRCYPASFRQDFADAMTADFAERAARAGWWSRLGLLLEMVADVVPSALGVHWELLRQDVRTAARSLGRAPGFALTAILVVALGVGANIAAFSVADFVLVRPLAFRDAGTLVRLCEGPRDGGGWGCNNEMSPASFRDFSSYAGSSFERMGAFSRGAANLVGGGEPQRLSVVRLTPDVFPILGMAPLIGRVFDSTGAALADARTVVLSYPLWRSRFGGDPGVLGRSVTLDDAGYQVIGVMPAAFRFPTRTVQAWTPLVFTGEDYLDRGGISVEGIGRLAPGVTFEAAQADINRAEDRLAREYPEFYQETGTSFFRMREEFAPRYRVMLLALCGASLAMVLLTCANLANLLLVRAAGRERELAVRAALGAGRERLVRQLVTENLLLALAGGVAGVLLAIPAVPLLARLVPTTLALAEVPSLDLRALAIAAGFTGVTMLGFGILPAWRAGRRPAFTALRDGGRTGGGRRQRLRSVLVTIEVAVSVALLASAGLLIRAVVRVQQVDPGFTATNVISLRTALPRPKYDSNATRAAFYRRVLSEVRALPGVESASYTSGLPMVMTGGINGVEIPGREVRRGENTLASVRLITPQFFRTFDIPLIQGRDLDDGDTGERAAVAVVSRSFAARFFPDADPVGRTFRHIGIERTIVGLVGDIRVRGLERTSEPQMYLPPGQIPDTMLGAYDPKDLVIRATRPAATILPAVRRIVASADPDQPISDVRSLDQVLSEQTAPRRAQLRVLVALAAIALLLAGVGIHGLLAYTVSQRHQEIGLRLALGAEPGGIARSVMREGVWLAVIGVVPGVAAAVLAGRGMRTLLFGVPPADPATIVVAVGLCLFMTLAGTLIPALRAVRVNPLTALRSE